MEHGESFPCLACGKVLERDHESYPAQPREGVMCSSDGNYGSTVWDPIFSGESMHFNICDECFVRAGQQGRLMLAQFYIPVVTDCPDDRSPSGTLVSQVGSKRVDSNFTPWTGPRHRGSDRREYLSLEEILLRYDDKNYRWTLPRENFEWMYDQQGEG